MTTTTPPPCSQQHTLSLFMHTYTHTYITMTLSLPCHRHHTDNHSLFHTTQTRTSRASVVHSSKNSNMGADAEPTEMYAISARFFTRPHAWPSGVSAGHTRPQCVLCSWRGLASLPSRPIGVLSRRRCDNVDENVSRFSTCDTPDLAPCPLFDVQLPVASEYLSPCELLTVLQSMTWKCEKKDNHTHHPYVKTTASPLRVYVHCFVLYSHGQVEIFALVHFLKHREV